MNSILKVFVFIFAIFIILHYRKYVNYTKTYEIEQQELDYIKGSELYNTGNLLVITFIENIPLIKNVELYKLFSPLSFNKKQFAYTFTDSYVCHNNELCLIRPKKEITLEFINPKFKTHFKKVSKKDNLTNYTLHKDNYSKVQSIQIIVREYNILYIPRFWLFKNNEQANIDMFLCDNIFTFPFSLIN